MKILIGIIVAILLALLVYLCGRQIKYIGKFNAYGDSCDYAHDMFTRTIYTQPDSVSRYYLRKEDDYIDSIDKYYNLMYPKFIQDLNNTK